MLKNIAIQGIIQKALEEDIQNEDITTDSIVPVDVESHAFLYVKEDGVIAGLQIAEMVFEYLDPNISFTYQKNDGDKVKKGDIVAKIEGKARAILTGERTALNLLQRMSGIATMTANLVEPLAYYNTEIVDTRKTAPGLRILDKYAVRVGGGKNHRFGLFDAVLIKDNHIKMAGGIKQAVSLARQRIPHTMRIEVETESLDAVKEALEARADIIMLDNMDLDNMKEAIEVIGGRALVEASGGITEAQILNIAKLGVDFISIGAITHSVKALDISLDFKQVKSLT